MARSKRSGGGTDIAPSAILNRPGIQVFKTKGFSRKARKAGISNGELWSAACALDLGQGIALGGDVWKKRLNENRCRSIVISKATRAWIFVELFEKSAQSDISPDELVALKKVAAELSKLSGKSMQLLVEAGELLEIRHA